ncbi:MAG: efflux RND transporter periplasmic adaptor subunit [Thiogranum sp.]
MKQSSSLNAAFIAVIVMLTAAAAWWLLDSADVPAEIASDHEHHAGHAEDNTPKGPHGGRLLSEDPFAIEVTIYERGVPPEFRVYAYYQEQPLAPEEVTLTIDLSRIDKQVDRFSFVAQADFLRGQGEVSEPHSFDVTINATYRDKTYRWHYENHEGRTQIGSALASASNIETGIAGPGLIRETLTLTGRVQTDPNRLSHVRARFPGIVQAVKKELGDTVEAGEVLATVQSNESLQTYAIKASIAGLIVRRDIQTGEATGNDPLFIIADLSQVWVELDVFGQNLNRVQQGQTVVVESLNEQPVSGTISWISPLAAHASQSVNARIELANENLQLRPGQFVRGQVTISEHEVPLAVRLSALQTFREFDVVFAKYGETYEVRMLTLGKRDDQRVEVIAGLKPGVEYVTGNSYLIKADIEKSGASHDH